MKIHHLNCGTLCPWGGRLTGGTGGLRSPGHMVCHCWLVESEQGLILVDTGLGTASLRHPEEQLGANLMRLGRPKLLLEECATEQIQKLGFQTTDVRHIILTHLDNDHAGGLSDFPHAQVHVFHEEYRAMTVCATWKEQVRYQGAPWAHRPVWKTHHVQGDRWFGFECVRQPLGLPPEVLLVPLPGHTRGHCGVAIAGNNGWLLHAGDAYFQKEEIETGSTSPILEVFEYLDAVDGTLRKQNLVRLHQLAMQHGHELTIHCSHDVRELAMFSLSIRQT
jgi:glyoxylase-like metal-dependent hydrolase (beta-lactamase superfamily II)